MFSWEINMMMMMMVPDPNVENWRGSKLKVDRKETHDTGDPSPHLEIERSNACRRILCVVCCDYARDHFVSMFFSSLTEQTSRSKLCTFIQIWTAVECSGAIYCMKETLIFPEGLWVRGKYVGWRSNFRSRAIWRYHGAMNSTSAQNKQSIFAWLSHHQKCTLIGEITGLYFSWIVDNNSKNTTQFQLVAGSSIHLLAYFSLWRIHGVQWMTFLWHFWYYLTVSNGSKYLVKIVFLTSVELKHVSSCEVWRSWLKWEPSC